MSGETPVFSPTRMKAWVRCPLYAHLLKETEPITDWKPNMLLGRSLDAGMTTVYRAVLETQGGPSYLEEVVSQGLSLARETLHEGYMENETWSLEGLEKLVSRTYEAALNEHVLDAGPLLAVDESLGVGRPDLIQRSRDGSHLLITDRKFTLKLEAQYLAKTLSEYEVDDQFWHYAWEAEQRWGIPVRWLRVHLLIGTPKPKSVLHPWQVEPAHLQFWLSGAEQNWKDMHEEKEGKRPVVPNWSNCMGKYGRCPFHGWCHEPQQRELFYRPVAPKNRLVDY